MYVELNYSIVYYSLGGIEAVPPFLISTYFPAGLVGHHGSTVSKRAKLVHHIVEPFNCSRLCVLLSSFFSFIMEVQRFGLTRLLNFKSARRV